MGDHDDEFGSDDDTFYNVNATTTADQFSARPGQLPAEVPLSRQFKFHSIFVCPVSREQASRDNPPMVLKCGHVICKKALLSFRGAQQGGRFKCPTCPTEQTVSECNEVSF